MPGFIHRLFGRDQGYTVELKKGPTVWSKGSCEEWYFKSKSSGLTWQKWWGRSLPAHIGLELLCYLVIYYIIHGIYWAALGEDERKEFEKIVDYFDKNLSPMAKEMTFLLGFYVSNVVKRWWEQYKSLPWPDTLVAISHALVDFNHEEGMKFCQTIMRYSMLSYILCVRRLSKALQQMFPDNDSLIKAKVATKRELSLLESNAGLRTDLGRVWWIPLSWSMSMIKSSKETKTVPSEQKILIDQIAKFQAKLENVDTFDSVILPPLYRQVVRFALWSYFLLALIGSQAKQDEPYIFLPLFLILRFIFYVGWLEVAEAIENPFGNDEDDFHVCQLVSRHLWAIGRNISLYEGPPGPPGEEDEDEEESESGEDDGPGDSFKLTINKSQ